MDNHNIPVRAFLERKEPDQPARQEEAQFVHTGRRVRQSMNGSILNR